MRHASKTYGWWIAVLIILTVVLLAACSGKYGTLRNSNAVGQAFQNFEMLDDYAYYFSGRSNKPSAIIGIDPAFEFESRFWTVIEPDQFQTMVGRLSPPDYGFLSGAVMLTPDGRKAGVWYSWVRIASVKFDGNRIMVSNPEPFADADSGGSVLTPD
jgi:hypothetical protein